MKVKHITRVKDTLHFRYIIPVDCRDYFKGKTAVKKSLNTDDIDTARIKAQKLAKIWKERIAKARELKKSTDL